MRIFLDTSVLLKLYHLEVDSKDIKAFFFLHKISVVYLAEITKVEFVSALWKKVRIKEISAEVARTTINLFVSDFQKYSFIHADNMLLQEATSLINKYGADGLRTLDSIQLSTCIHLSKKVDLFITSDKLLKELLQKENLPVEVGN